MSIIRKSSSSVARGDSGAPYFIKVRLVVRKAEYLEGFVLRIRCFIR